MHVHAPLMGPALERLPPWECRPTAAVFPGGVGLARNGRRIEATHPNPPPVSFALDKDTSKNEQD